MPIEKWFCGSIYGCIEEIEVESSTAKTVVRRNGRRQAKDTSYEWVRPTRAEAVELARGGLLRDIENAESRHKNAKAALAKFDDREGL